MGSIIFHPGVLSDSLSELVGYKAGLAVSVAELCDHLSGTELPDLVRTSEERVVRVRAEDFDSLCYKLLHRVGYTSEEFDGDVTGAYRFRKYRKLGKSAELEIVMEIWLRHFQEIVACPQQGRRSIDLESFVRECATRLGKVGLELAIEQIEIMARAQELSPHGIGRRREWQSEVELAALFAGTAQSPEEGKFIDQRYIDYLSVNGVKLGEVHWRKFEELTAEYYDRHGYRVEIGPGRNDDGVDLRVWKPSATPTDSPLCIVQCKRHKEKIDKVTVKGLHADVEHEGASFGVIVTTSELSPGARTTIDARGYSIQEVNRAGLKDWLAALRTPGTGIVRI